MLIQFKQRARFRARRLSSIVASLIPVAMLSGPTSAHGADDITSAPMFSFSGFGTVGLVHSSEDRADFTASPLAPNGAGYTHSWSPDIDSRLGAQVIAHFTPQLSAMLQVVSEQRYDKTFRPQVEFYSLSPVFYSDGADVNYKMHFGGVISTLVGTYGNATFRAAGGGEFDVRRLWVIADNVEYGSLTFHIAYQASS